MPETDHLPETWPRPGVCTCRPAGGSDDAHLVNCGVYFTDADAADLETLAAALTGPLTLADQVRAAILAAGSILARRRRDDAALASVCLPDLLRIMPTRSAADDLGTVSDAVAWSAGAGYCFADGAADALARLVGGAVLTDDLAQYGTRPRVTLPD